MGPADSWCLVNLVGGFAASTRRSLDNPMQMWCQHLGVDVVVHCAILIEEESSNRSRKNMLDRIKMWWHRKHKTVTRSSKNHEDLTDYEQDTIRHTGKCPDCGGKLKEGPHGGMSVNHVCLQCHSEFNLTIIGEAVIGGRISDAGPRDIGERAWAYGL